MLKLWKVVFLFWRPLLLWNILFSIPAFAGMYLYGLGFFGVGLLIKLIGYASSVYFQHHFSGEKKYYFLNMGYATWKLYLYTFILDLILYILGTVLYFKFR